MKELSVTTFKKKTSEHSSKKNQKSIQDKFLPKLHSIKSQRHRKKTIKDFFGRSSHSPSKSNLIKQLSASSHQNSETTIAKVIPQEQLASEPPPLPSVDRLRSIVKRHSTCDCTINEKCLKPTKPPRGDAINLLHTHLKENSEECIYHELDFEDHVCDQKDDAVDENNDRREPLTEEENDYSELSSFLKLDGLKDSIDLSCDDTKFFFDTMHANLLIEMKESFKRRKTIDRNNSDDVNSLFSDSTYEDKSADYRSIPVDEKRRANACKNYAAIEGLYARVNKKKNVNMPVHENRTVSSEESPPTVIHESTWL